MRDQAKEIVGRFGERLRELREQAALSQQQLSELAGIRQASVSAYERGETRPSLEHAVALALALGVGIPAFLRAPENKQNSG